MGWSSLLPYPHPQGLLALRRIVAPPGAGRIAGGAGTIRRTRGRGRRGFGAIGHWLSPYVYGPGATIGGGRSNLIPSSGTIWDMTTADLQTEIKKLLRRLGWSQDQAAQWVYGEQYDDDDAAERCRFSEAFRKKLNRPTTPPEWLQEVLAILSEQPDARKIAPPVPRPAKSPHLPEAIQRAMRTAGRQMAKEIQQEEEAID